MTLAEQAEVEALRTELNELARLRVELDAIKALRALEANTLTGEMCILRLLQTDNIDTIMIMGSDGSNYTWRAPRGLPIVAGSISHLEVRVYRVPDAP